MNQSFLTTWYRFIIKNCTFRQLSNVYIKMGAALIVLLTVILPVAAQQPTDYVNPLIGTNGMGHVFPGACTPFGWVQLSPDTDTIPHNVGGVYQKGTYAYCAGYRYQDPTIVGFSHTHLSGTGH